MKNRWILLLLMLIPVSPGYAEKTERVSVASDGTEAIDNSKNPSISVDGWFVAFGSSASNLVPDDTNNTFDIFVHNRQTGTTERVSVASDGTEANSTSYASPDYGSDISADGRFVVFHSSASNLIDGDTN